jgi:hypothetical protein
MKQTYTCNIEYWIWILKIEYPKSEFCSFENLPCSRPDTFIYLNLTPVRVITREDEICLEVSEECLNVASK